MHEKDSDDVPVTEVYRKNEDGTITCVARDVQAGSDTYHFHTPSGSGVEQTIMQTAARMIGPKPRKPTKAEKRLAKRQAKQGSFERGLKQVREMRQYARSKSPNARAAERRLNGVLATHAPVPELARDVTEALARVESAAIGVAVEVDKIRRGL